jgi:hypothetical protein
MKDRSGNQPSDLAEEEEAATAPSESIPQSALPGIPDGPTIMQPNVLAEARRKIAAKPGVWPHDVPEPDQCLEILLRPDEATPKHQSQVQQLLKELPAKAVASLDDAQDEFDVAVLRAGALTLFRLVTASSMRPDSGMEIDQEAYVELLSEIDGILELLQISPTVDDPEVITAFAWLRDGITGAGVSLASCFEAACPQIPKEEIEKLKREKKKTARPRAIDKIKVPKHYKSTNSGASRQRVLSVVFVMCLIASLSYHLVFNRDSAVKPTLGGNLTANPTPKLELPAGMVGEQVEYTRATAVVSQSIHGPDAEALEQLHTRAEKQGMKVHAMSTSMFILLPEETDVNIAATSDLEREPGNVLRE